MPSGFFRSVKNFFEEHPHLRNFPSPDKARELLEEMDKLLEQEDDMEDTFGPSSGDSFLQKAEEIKQKLEYCGYDIDRLRET